MPGSQLSEDIFSITVLLWFYIVAWTLTVFLESYCDLFECLKASLSLMRTINCLHIISDKMAFGCPELKARLTIKWALFCLRSQLMHILVVSFGEGSKVRRADIATTLLYIRTVNSRKLQLRLFRYLRINSIFSRCAVMCLQFDLIENIISSFQCAIDMFPWLFHFYFLFES